MLGYYKCECGKEFNNPQSFNGHKCHCKIHYEAIGKIQMLNIYNDKRGNSIHLTFQKIKRISDQKRLNEWVEERHICEKCGKVMTEKYASGRFCSRACANSRIKTKETKEKISNTLKSKIKKTSEKRNIEDRKCKICGKILKKRSISGLCNNCYRYSIEGKSYRRSAALKSNLTRKEHNSFSGWQSRNIISYPEKFWIKVLDNNNIKYVKEYIVKCTKEHRYFLDFFIEKDGRKIDLEIDGKQHDYPEIKEKDLIRDKLLTEKGFTVYRVKWNEISSEKGKKIMETKINSFINFINIGELSNGNLQENTW